MRVNVDAHHRGLSSLVALQPKGAMRRRPHCESTRVECMECGHRFSKRIGSRTYEIVCPKCKSIDVEVM